MSNWKKETILKFIHNGKLEKKNRKQADILYSNFKEPKLDKETLSSAFMDSYTKKVMPSIRKDKRTIKDDLHMRVWNKDWRK